MKRPEITRAIRQSPASFTAGFPLACGTARELGLEPLYSFHQEEERTGKG